MLEAFAQNAKAVLEQPMELFLTVFAVAGAWVLNSVRRFFKKGGLKTVIKMSFGYMIDLLAKNSSELSEAEAEEKKKLVNAIVGLPELKPYFEKADAKFEQIIDDYEGRLNDIDAKLELGAVEGNTRTRYLEERKKLTDKLAVLYEKVNQSI